MSVHEVPQIAYPKLPFEPQAEQVTLGGCLLDNKKIPQVRAVCAAEDFQEPLHRRIATGIYAIDAEFRPVTPLTIKAYLGDDRGLEQLGGFGYLVSLAEAGSTDPVGSGRVVADTAARRGAMIAIWDAQEELSRGDKTIGEILSPVVKQSEQAAERCCARAGSESAGEAAYAMLRSLDAPDGDIGISTGLTALNDLVGALYPGNLYVVAGRPGMGKTALGVSLARAAAQSASHSEYYSLEMPRRQISARLVSDLEHDSCPNGQYPLQYSRLLRRKAGPHEILRAMDATNALKALPITIHDRDSMSATDIAALARARVARLGGLGVVIIDHLHLIRPDDRYRGNQTQELGETAKAAKRLARALNWPVVLLAQLNRAVENRPEKDRMPTLADLRQSGEIEEAADVVIFLHRPAYYVERKRPPGGPTSTDWSAWLMDMEPVRHELNLDIAKHRNGETGTIRVYVDIGANAIRDAKDHR